MGLRSNLVANVTVNTDFADTQVDLQNFNLTPYPLYYPEKRQFFLENAGIFNFPLGGDSGDLLFFSRQIGIDPVTGQEVPVNAGGKVAGSLGNFELGVMDVDTSGTILTGGCKGAVSSACPKGAPVLHPGWKKCNYFGRFTEIDLARPCSF